MWDSRLARARVMAALSMLLVGCAESGGAPSQEPPAGGGCGRDPGESGLRSGTITAAGLERAYLLVLPEGYQPDRAHPVVFAFHGLGSNAEQLRFYAGVEEAAGGAAVFVYPQGIPLDTENGATGWDLAPDGHDLPFFDALVEEIDAQLCIDQERRYVTGHSFGAWMSNTLGCLRGDRVRAIAPVAGGGPLGECSGPVAAWIAHGQGDPIVFTALGEASRDFWVGANGCDASTAPIEPAPCVAYAGCSAGHEVTWCLHDEQAPVLGTHTWPTFAGAAIWAFFQEH